MNACTLNACTLGRMLDSLYRDLETVHNSDEETVCRLFGADSRQEVLQLIMEEIDSLEETLRGFVPCEDDGMDYDALCASQGLSRFA